ncbi:STM3941 family protein [Knoellia sinensis]|uniref:STM3941 family protein n=1 Tax=Knoellia sinensis TaxID=136100 RepID=UPI0012EBF3B9|nr:STM3941 family protein [Knoellia sinensis]
MTLGGAESVVIERSRVKTLLALGGCVLFVVGSVAIWRAESPVIGILGLVTFGVFGAYILHALFRSGPGLVVDDEGFTDQSSAGAVGRVLWADVTELGTWSHQGANVLVVGLRNPEDYVARLSAVSRRYARVNLSMMGTPVTIASTGLKTDYDSLFALMNERLERSRLRLDSNPPRT